MAVVSAPSVADKAAEVVTLSTTPVIVPFEPSMGWIPAPAYSGNEGQGNQSVGYATD